MGTEAKWLMHSLDCGRKAEWVLETRLSGDENAAKHSHPKDEQFPQMYRSQELCSLPHSLSVCLSLSVRDVLPPKRGHLHHSGHYNRFLWVRGHVTMKEVASQEASLGWRIQEASDFQPVAQKPLVLTVRKGMQRLSWQKKPVGDKGPPVWVAFPGRAHEVGQEVSLAPLIVGRFRCTPHPRQNSGLRAQKEMTKLLGPEVIKDSGKPAQPSRRSVPH